MQALVLSLLLMQSNVNVNPQTWAEQQKLLWDLHHRQQSSPQNDPRVRAEMEAARAAAVEQYFFARKFNKLVSQLKEFADQYNTGSVDAKKVKAIKKAWEDLQKTEGWFKTIPSKPSQSPPENKLQA